eukprot:TRINITY_DN15736_c0_g1_i1.p1 TRINITY_DN15736_c0_g1~~TRINITY_DN15736_c0_g1_i1.p1  ORF type:complete len:199 (+),score=49.33 TRINITY_DN15736_c0_g1_i1:82-597(+)
MAGLQFVLASLFLVACRGSLEVKRGDGESCGLSGPKQTHCSAGHTCCAIDSGDPDGFCCPQKGGWDDEVVQCAFGIDGLGAGKHWVRNCCAGKPVCGAGVGYQFCCLGPRSKLSADGCSNFGAPDCCNAMCGDDLCDLECKELGGTCIVGNSTEGGRCITSAGQEVRPPVV